MNLRTIVRRGNYVAAVVALVIALVIALAALTLQIG